MKVGLSCLSQIMKVLNVAEKNDAAKNIASLLSRGGSRVREGFSKYNKIYEFQYNAFGQATTMTMTSVSGHLLSYDFAAAYRGWNSCSPVDLFDAPLVKSCPQDYQNIKRTLEREVRGSQTLIIWTDCDREGENIGYEVIDTCRAVNPNITVYRAKFSEITRQSVERAMRTLTPPNQNISEAVDVRQQLDLRIGAAFTRFQTLRLKHVFPETLADNLISYGSCQFPTLGFVVERFKAIADFVSEPFWKINVSHTKDNLTVDFSWKRNRLFDQHACQVLLDVCQEEPTATVSNVKSKQKLKWRPRPLDTVELEKLGSRKLNINAKETMKIAEKLYTQGFISYPRTETNMFPKELNLVPLVESQCVDPQWGSFAQVVLQDGPNPFQGTKTDQAHPPIHPTKYTDNLSGNEKRIYELVVRHFLACLSKHAEGLETTVDIDIAGEEFVATGLMIIARNYLDVYPYDRWNAKEIHIYQVGDTFVPVIEMGEGSTSPPNLLTEADLIALMEKHGIGTDATHADHIETIKSRLYVGLRDNKYFVPGTLGMGLVEGYDSMGFAMSKPNLRAELESDLKCVCEGTKSGGDVLREQLAKYKRVFQQAQAQVEELDRAVGRNLRVEAQPVGPGAETQPMSIVMKCPVCNSDVCLRERKNREGKYMTCTAYPNCRHSVWFPSIVTSVEKSDETCPHCGPNTFMLDLKFERGSCYLPTNYRGCVGGCDVNLLQILNFNVRRATTTTAEREPLRIVSANEDSGFETNTRTAADDIPVKCKCGKTAVKLKTRKQGANFGREFYKCDAQQDARGCNFFQWIDEVNNDRVTPAAPPPPPRATADNDENTNCYCAVPCRMFTVQKEGPNVGRQFYSCSKSMTDPDRCKYFKWLDEVGGGDDGVVRFETRPAQRTQWNNNNRNNTDWRKRKGGVGEQPTKKRKCGICGQEGHNRKNCRNQ